MLVNIAHAHIYALQIMLLFGAIDDIKVHRVFDLLSPQSYRVNKLIAGQIREDLYQGRLDSRTIFLQILCWFKSKCNIHPICLYRPETDIKST